MQTYYGTSSTMVIFSELDQYFARYIVATYLECTLCATPHCGRITWWVAYTGNQMQLPRVCCYLSLSSTPQTLSYDQQSKPIYNYLCWYILELQVGLGTMAQNRMAVILDCPNPHPALPQRCSCQPLCWRDQPLCFSPMPLGWCGQLSAANSPHIAQTVPTINRQAVDAVELLLDWRPVLEILRSGKQVFA